MPTTAARRAVVVLSGGQDSTTCLFWALQLFDEVQAVTFDYGQRHNIEVRAAHRVVMWARHHFGQPIHHEVVHLGNSILKGTSPLVSGEELEQYESPESLPGGLEKTFVPMRNQLFLTIAANRAYIFNARNLITGVSAEDYGGYPDCRPGFIHAVEEAANRGTFTGEPGTVSSLKIHTPLMYVDKAGTAELSRSYDGLYPALAYSHTAYDGVFPPTGKDHASHLRNKGFEEAGIPDPLVLRAVLEGKMELPDRRNYQNDEQVHTCMEKVAEIMDFMEVEDA